MMTSPLHMEQLAMQISSRTVYSDTSACPSDIFYKLTGGLIQLLPALSACPACFSGERDLDLWCTDV